MKLDPDYLTKQSLDDCLRSFDEMRFWLIPAAPRVYPEKTIVNVKEFYIEQTFKCSDMNVSVFWHPDKLKGLDIKYDTGEHIFNAY